MDRVYIVGGGGSGKTTLAGRMARQLGVEPFDLDSNSRIDRRVLAAGDRWVVEGIYLFDIEPLLQRAELVIWLDVGRRTCLRRIVIRHIWLTLRRRNRHPGLGLLWRFMRGTADYYRTAAREPTHAHDFGALSRALTIERLAPHDSKVVRLGSPREVRRFRRQMKADLHTAA